MHSTLWLLPQTHGCLRYGLAIQEVAAEHRLDRLIVVSAAVSEAIAFPGYLQMLSCRERLVRVHRQSKASATRPLNEWDSRVSLLEYASYLFLMLQAHGTPSPTSMQPCGDVGPRTLSTPTLPRVRAPPIPIAAFSFSRPIPQLSIT